jgi:hypothetical protein
MDATQGTNKLPKCNSLHIMSKLDWLEKAKAGTADSRIREARKPQVRTIRAFPGYGRYFSTDEAVR